MTWINQTAVNRMDWTATPLAPSVRCSLRFRPGQRRPSTRQAYEVPCGQLLSGHRYGGPAVAHHRVGLISAGGVIDSQRDGVWREPLRYVFWLESPFRAKKKILCFIRLINGNAGWMEDGKCG